MKKYLLLIAILPILASPFTIRKYDWFRVIKEFSGCGWWLSFTCHPGDRIYCYYFKDSRPTLPCYEADIYLFDSKGKVKGWYWLTDWREIAKVENDRLCTFLENRKDNRYK